MRVNLKNINVNILSQYLKHNFTLSRSGSEELALAVTEGFSNAAFGLSLLNNLITVLGSLGSQTSLCGDRERIKSASSS